MWEEESQLRIPSSHRATEKIELLRARCFRALPLSPQPPSSKRRKTPPWSKQLIQFHQQVSGGTVSTQNLAGAGNNNNNNNKQPTTNNQQPTTNNQQPTANSQQPTTNNKQQTTTRENQSLIGAHPARLSPDLADPASCTDMSDGEPRLLGCSDLSQVAEIEQTQPLYVRY